MVAKEAKIQELPHIRGCPIQRKNGREKPLEKDGAGKKIRGIVCAPIKEQSSAFNEKGDGCPREDVGHLRKEEKKGEGGKIPAQCTYFQHIVSLR